jgi:hypothetical protein
MSKREQWRKVLEREVERWSAIPYSELVSALRDEQVYEVEFDSRKYQVEVEMLQNTDRYIQVCVAVDDGSLPASLEPVSHIFVCNKPNL